LDINPFLWFIKSSSHLRESSPTDRSKYHLPTLPFFSSDSTPEDGTLCVEKLNYSKNQKLSVTTLVHESQDSTVGTGKG
jgi:hypothetical protein